MELDGTHVMEMAKRRVLQFGKEEREKQNSIELKANV